MEDLSLSTMEQAWASRNSNRAAARSASEALLAGPLAAARPRALAQVVLSYLDYREHRYAQAVESALEALTVLEVNPADAWLPRLYNTLAIIHLDLGERDASRAYLDRQIRLSGELGDRTYEALGYHDLGLLQAALEPERGLESLAHARALFRTANDVEHEALALYNMANICLHAGERGRAVDCTYHALQLVQGSRAVGLGMHLRVHIATHLAEAASAQGRYSSARVLLDEARALAGRHLPELLPHVQFCQGLHLVAVGDDMGARAQFQEALAQLGPNGSRELLADCYVALADCTERLGDYRAALGYQRSYTAIRERTFAEASEQKVRALEVIHQVSAARQRNAELQQSIQELEQLQETLRALSVRDPLTGLYNRRFLREEGERRLRDAQREGAGLCAAMVDVDRFKRINDELGHQVGDRVLEELAALLTQTLRSTDLIARYGGEEIALLLAARRVDDAYHVCERLRSVVAQHDWARIHPQLQVTVSIGLASADSGTLDELLSRADARLYVSKRAGRNRTSAEEEARLLAGNRQADTSASQVPPIETQGHDTSAPRGNLPQHVDPA